MSFIPSDAMNRVSVLTLRLLAAAALSVPGSASAADCNCATNLARIEALHGIPSPGSVALIVGGDAKPNPTDFPMEHGKEYTLLIQVTENSPIICDHDIFIKLELCGIEWQAAGSSEWKKGMPVIKYTDASEGVPVVDYTPDYIKIRVTDPASDDKSQSPSPGGQATLNRSAPSMAPNPLGGSPVLDPGQAGLEIPMGAAMGSDGMFHSAGRLVNHGGISGAFAAPSSFAFNFTSEVASVVDEETVLNGSSQVTEKHFVTPDAVLRLRGWDGSAAEDYTGSDESVIEVYEASQYNASTDAFTGSPHSYYRIEREPANGIWAEGIILTQSNRGVLRTETLQQSTDQYSTRHQRGGETTEALLVPTGSGSSTWTVTTTVERDAVIVSKVSETWSQQTWGKALLDSTVDPDPAISGDALATFYSYYADGRTKSVSHPDGSWKFHTYNGTTTTTYTPWLSQTNLVFSSGVWSLPSSGLVTVREATRTSTGSTDVTYYKDLSSSGLGTMISKTQESIDESTGRTTTKRYRDASTAVESYTLVYPPGTTPAWLTGRTIMTWDKSGRASLHAYDRGTWTAGGGFASNSGGTYVKETRTTGTVSSPSANSTTGNFVAHAGRSRRTETITGPEGAVQESDWICDSTGAFQAALTKFHEYESSGLRRPTGTKVNGIFVSKNEYPPASPLVTKTYDESGAFTETETDAYGELIRTTTSGNTEVPAVTTAYARSGRTRTTSVDSQVVSTETTDIAGRTVSTRDSSGAETKIKYTDGGRTVTREGPGESPNQVTTIESRHYDGRLSSITGTAVVPSYYSYAVNSTTGRITETTRIGTLNSLRATSVERNLDGSTAYAFFPDPSGGLIPLSQTYTYDANTAEVRKITSSVSTSAEQVFTTPSDSAAAALGMYSLSGMQTDLDGPEVESTDRVTATDSTFVQSGGVWCLQTVQSQYHTDDFSYAYTTTATEALSPVPVSHGTYGSGLRWTSSVARGGRTVTTHRDHFFSGVATLVSVDDSATGASPDSISITRHGREISSSAYGSTAAHTRTYDGAGRVIREVSPLGAVTRYRYDGAGRLSQISDHENNITSYSYYPSDHFAAGRVWKVTNPAGEVVETIYDTLGRVVETTGSGTYRVTWAYNTWGERYQMRTYRSGTTGDLTEWTYKEDSGLLEKKTDAAGKETTYQYNPLGSVALRTSARGIDTTYTYNAFGDLTGKTYEDDTPDVTITPDRLGRRKQVVDASGTRTITYNSEGEELVAYASGGLLSGLQVDYTWSNLRPTGYSVNGTGAPAVVLGYDTAGRISSVSTSGSSGSDVHSHEWLPGTGILREVTTHHNQDGILARTLYRDRMGRVRGIETTDPNAQVLSRHGYTLDAAGRRTQAVRENGQRWTYGYDSRGQVTSGTKSFTDGSAIPGHSFAYAYDGIGNRTSATQGGSGTAVDYNTANNLNQYTTVETQGSRYVYGESPASTVTVNGSAAARAGGLGFFWAKIDGDNSSGPLWSEDEVVQGSPTETVDDFTFTPAATVSRTHDFDGNLTYDGRWNYTWDAENRLTRMETAAIAYDAGAPRLRLDFAYDDEGRRVAKYVLPWNGSVYAFGSGIRFLYDGWNLICEYSVGSAGSTSLTLKAVHTWGPDLSGTLQGAGGVGGLLATELKNTANTCYPVYDGNGNITGWTDVGGNLLARSDYSPFGQPVSLHDFDAHNLHHELHFGFSTKYTDAETGLLYYGYRYYSPDAGDWLSRDPIGHNGGVNLYGFLGNNPTMKFDFLGLRWPEPGTDGGPPQGYPNYHPSLGTTEDLVLMSGSIDLEIKDFTKNGTDNAATGTITLGMELWRTGELRLDYVRLAKELEAKGLTPGQAAAARDALKEEFRKQQTALGKAMTEALLKKRREAGHIVGRNNPFKTNVNVNATAKVFKYTGRALATVGVGVEIYNIASAPEEERLEEAAKAGGRVGGGILGGMGAGALGGSWFGPWGAGIGAIIGGIGGSFAGEGAVELFCEEESK